MLLEKGVECHWDDQQEQSFKALKAIHKWNPSVEIFVPNNGSLISVDATSKGMGAVLLQDVHIKITHQNSTKLCPDWKGDVCYCIWLHLLSQVHLWDTTDESWNRLQTVRNDTQETTSSNSQTSENGLGCAEIPYYLLGKELVIADTLSRASAPDKDSNPILEEFEICDQAWQNSAYVHIKIDRLFTL